MLGRHRQALRVIKQGQEVYPDRRDFTRLEADALALLGRVDQVRRLLETELLLPAERSRWRIVATLLKTQGYEQEAADIINAMIDWYESRPEEEAIEHRARYARALYEAGRWDDAHAIYQELNQANPDTVVRYLALIAAHKGDRDEALLWNERIAEIRNRNAYDFGYLEFFQARLYALLGDRERAVNLLWEAFQKGAAYDHLMRYTREFESLQGYPAFEEFFRPKG